MAEFSNIVELRLRIKDPIGVIAITSIADATERIAITSPSRQTAYMQEDTGEYYIYDFDLLSWEQKDVFISDSRIGLLIDLYGIDRATPRTIKDILSELGQRLFISQTSDGAGSTQYQNLATMKNFYQDLINIMEDSASRNEGLSTGRYVRICRPSIAGGMQG